MRRKKHLDRGGGGGTELFICFTSRPSAASAAGAPSSLRTSSSSKLLSPGRVSAGGAGAEAVTAPPLHPSLSRRLRNSGSLKGGQSPMFPSGSTAGGGRRGRGGLEPAEPSSPKVTCIGQVRVKGGKRKPKHASSAAALRSCSRRVGDVPQAAKNQGWVYQIPVNICEALGSCGARSLCSPSRPGGVGERGGDSADAHAGKRRRQRAPAGGSWLCGAAVARCLLPIQEVDDDDDVGKGAAIVPAEDMRASEVGLVMEGWDVEEEEKAVLVGEVEVEKKDDILVLGKEEEGRVSVCIPPRNALLLMRCRSDPVRMAALATRFWGSPAAATATVEQVDAEVPGGVNQDEDEEEEEDEEDEDEAEPEPEECKDKARHSAVSVKDANCGELGGSENEDGEAGKIDQAEAQAEQSSKCGDLVEEDKCGSCRVEVEEAQIVRKDAALEVSLGEDMAVESQGPDMLELVVSKEKDTPAQEKVEEEVKGRRSISSCSPSAVLKEDCNKLRRLNSRRCVASRRASSSSASDRVGRRHSFSAEMEARRSSFSSSKDSRRASFSIDRDGRRWSFSIEQEHLVAEPKVLMASRKGKKPSSEQDPEKDCAGVVAPNSAEEGPESYDDGKEEDTTKNQEEGETQNAETNREVEKVEIRAKDCEAGPLVQRRKKSGELPDCLLLMMYEPKLSMEVSKETWVCSTDFVHWKSYQGKNNCNRRPQKTLASGNDAATATGEVEDKENSEGSTVDTKESKDPSMVNLTAVRMAAPVAQETPPLDPDTTEQKTKLELPLVTNAAAYAPFVLKRCKSEPMRSSARLAPDCFWKDRHRPLNATGVGF
ncbi:hypothetical protein HU200_030421 [Digitaria exilis]|uniref:Chloroplast protein HCF243 n=1 Tax=Digitaria exilis TaxID=1010633 RepID=A0A835C360_9POAL|nr:hypothetical protein HU200_030421 [Digitaria exilis]CAB3462971.1 unnamed protein product [Digitaria exilis]